MLWLCWTMMKLGPSLARFFWPRQSYCSHSLLQKLQPLKSWNILISSYAWIEVQDISNSNMLQNPSSFWPSIKSWQGFAQWPHTHSQLGTTTRIDTWQQYCTVLEPKFGSASHRNMVQFSEWWVIEVLRSGSGHHLKPDTAVHVHKRGDIQLILLDPFGKLLDDRTKWWRM